MSRLARRNVATTGCLPLTSLPQREADLQVTLMSLAIVAVHLMLR